MNTLARKLIAVVQNSLLGSLAGRLIVIFFCLGNLADNFATAMRMWVLDPSFSFYIVGCQFLALVSVPLLMWLIGFLAIHRVSAPFGPMERLPGAPRNSFEAWTQPPPGGFRPPRSIGSLVVVLGWSRPGFAILRNLLFGIVFIGCVSLMFAIYSDRHLALYVLGPLSRPAQRPVILAGIFVLAIALVVRSWAVHWRGRLADD